MDFKVNCALLVVLTVAVSAAVPLSGSLCKTCRCADVTVTCDCSTSTEKDIFVQSNSLMDFRDLEKFEVRKCHSLTLFQDSFKNALRLQTLSVNQVKNVSFDAGVFHALDSLVIGSIDSLILKKSAFQGVKTINSIVIQRSNIPVLPTWSLYDISELKELRIEETVIHNIERDAVLIDMKHSSSNALILNSKIGRVVEKGLQIGNATNLKMTGTEIQKAEPNSIRLSSRNLMTINSNVFHNEVDVDGVYILFNGSMNFQDNTLYNIPVNTSEDFSTFTSKTSHTLQHLVYEKKGNLISCECANITNTTGVFYQNLCKGGCHDSSLAEFLKVCQANKGSVNDILKKICKENFTTPRSSSSVLTTPKPGKSGARNIFASLTPLHNAVIFSLQFIGNYGFLKLIV